MCRRGYRRGYRRARARLIAPMVCGCGAFFDVGMADKCVMSNIRRWLLLGLRTD